MNSIDSVDSIMGQLDPEIAKILGDAAPPPSGSSAADPNAVPPPNGLDPVSVSPFYSGERVAPKREQTAALKEAQNNVKAHVSPALKRLGKVAELVPGAERVRIRKMLDNGQLGFIGDYSVRDIETSGDLEIHLHRYVRPTHKGGSYYISIFDSKGLEHNAGVIPLVDAPPEAPQESALGLVREMMNRMEQQKMSYTPPPDPIEQMMRMQTAMQRMKEMTGQKDGSGDSMMMMMLMQQMQAQQAPKGPDPILVALLDKMDRRMEQLEKKVVEGPPLGALPPPLPPPMPVADPVETIVKLMPLLAPKEDKDRLSTRDILELVMAKGRNDDQPTWRDVIEMMNRKREEEKPQQTVLDQIQAVAAAKQALDQLSPQGHSSQTTFWDAIGALFSQEKFGAGIGAAIGAAVKAKAEEPALPASRPAAQLQPGPQVQRAIARPLPAQVAPPPAEVQPPKIVFPESMKEIAKKLSSATEDAQRVDLVVQSMFVLHSTPQWKQFVMDVLSKTAENQREIVLEEYLRPWLGLLVAAELVTSDAGKQTLRAFDENWHAVHSEIAKRLGRPVQEPSAAAPAPLEPVPSPNAAETQDDDNGLETDFDEPFEADEPSPSKAMGPQIVDLPDDVYLDAAGF